MTTFSIHRIRESGYRNTFLAGVLIASFLPMALFLLNYEVTGSSVQALVYIASLFLIIGGAHVWLTLAYYADRAWLKYFSAHPKEFFLAPALILLATTALIALPAKSVAMLVVNATIFLNLWHHAKQNWGIMAIVGKIQKSDVAAWRLPIVYAWPFFLIPVALYVAETRELLGHDQLKTAAQICSLLYVGFVAACVAKVGWSRTGDKLSKLFAIVLCGYFMPTVWLYGKPYSLAVWAVAHAMQYYLFVLASLALRDRRGESRSLMVKSISVVALAMALLSGVAYLATQYTKGPDLWSSTGLRAVLGFVTGVNLVHFWLDAFIWKFSNAEVRRMHGDAFQFDAVSVKPVAIERPKSRAA